MHPGSVFVFALQCSMLGDKRAENLRFGALQRGTS
jgi:hypothetical protein